MNILKDIKTVIRLTGEVRKARKNGASAVQLRPVYTVPVVSFPPAYPNTIEGCLTWKLERDTDRAVKAVFNSFPYETQRQLELSPQKPGEWVERARFWQRELRPVLPPKVYHEVILLFLSWYIHCRKLRSGMGG